MNVIREIFLCGEAEAQAWSGCHDVVMLHSQFNLAMLQHDSKSLANRFEEASSKLCSIDRDKFTHIHFEAAKYVAEMHGMLVNNQRNMIVLDAMRHLQDEALASDTGNTLRL